jgi:hypothetical protein
MGRLLAMAVQRSSNVALWVVLVGACAGTFAISAWGTYVGKNGRIAFSRTLASNGETRGLVAMNPDGTGIRKLTNPPSGVSRRSLLLILSRRATDRLHQVGRVRDTGDLGHEDQRRRPDPADPSANWR